MKQKLTLEPGKKYKGVGFINEYGEMQFTPYQQGTRTNALKIVTECNDFSLYQSANLIQVRVTIKKDRQKGKLEQVMELMKAFQNACLELKKYL